MSQLLRFLARSEDGATMVEYALIVGLIAAVSTFSLWWLSIQLQFSFLVSASKLLGS